MKSLITAAALLARARLRIVTMTLAPVLLLGSPATAAGLGLDVTLIADRPAGSGECFPLVAQGEAAPIWYAGDDYPGVRRAIGDLQADIERVTACRPAGGVDRPQRPDCVLIGTVGRNAALDALIAQGRLDARDLRGKWESFVITTIADPWPGTRRVLVVAGSDKRGTIYGIYELAEQLGVSPWHWWADVSPRRRTEAFVRPGRYASGEPAVRYRGIFINDEAPCLTGWAKEQFGGLNSKFYTRVFELLLRLRANYLWPAMWDNAFNEDDPENPRLADEYGIVMGTSHHEPMMRAHKEWTTRREQYGNGQWNYATNAEALQRFFREGIARNRAYDNLVTIGLRGDGDEGMASSGNLESDLKLLERIFTDQRRILAEETGRDASQTPQLWALFTEVQKFYEHGLRPPDDVTLLWTDDNTGNLRRLPTAEERQRSGGAGIYYHIDMHGGPFAYQWINTNPLPKIAEQMTLAHEYGANRIWILNVGDIKPLELPLEFFLRMAWNPRALGSDRVGEYTRRWSEREFGPEHSGEIADLVAQYAKFNGWRKPELLSPETFSQINYREAERVEAAWTGLVARAERLHALLPPGQRDAFYQLVLHPVKASAVVAGMNIAAGRNHLFAQQGRASTNAMATRTRELFREDQALSDTYNHQLAGGKWNHLMDQPHLGQVTWQPPRVNAMPAVAEVLPADNDHFGVAIEGDASAWPDHWGDAVLPVADSLNPRRSYLEVFAEGTRPIDFAITAAEPWIRLIADERPRLDRRYWVEIDWAKAPTGAATGTISVRGNRGTVVVKVPTIKATAAQALGAKGRFASLAGPIAIAAPDGRRVAAAGANWVELPDYGRGASALSIHPVTAGSILPPAPAPAVEYPVYLPHDGIFELTLILGPVLDFVPGRGLRVAVAVDDQPAQVLDVFANREAETFLGKGWWTQYTRDNARYLRSTHNVAAAGPHIVRVTMVDPGIVLQKLVIGDARVPGSYFGPPECETVK